MTSIMPFVKIRKKCMNKVGRKMVKALDDVPYKERQWGHCWQKI